jgi:two-component system OmpR family response regulator/two-component system response regulator RstA
MAATLSGIAMKTDVGPRVILVEDDDLQGTMLELYLRNHGMEVERILRGDQAPARILETQPDAVILDTMLPGKDGFDICREVRRGYAGPILMLTARSENFDQILGLELGADNYLIKPVEPRLILAHLRASLRRPSVAGNAPEEFSYGRFYISRASRVVRLADREITFSTAEFELLWLLAEHAGSVLSRDTIKRSLHGIDHDGLDRSIDMRISRLRRKLDDDAEQPKRIKTVRNQGYLFSRTDWG